MATFADIVAYFIGILNQVVYVLIGLAVVIFLWGMVKYVRNTAIGKRQDKKAILWSLLTLFVLVSVWGILRLMCASFGANLCDARSVNWNANSGLYQQSGPSANGGIYPI
jgi:hypothetical protein